MRSEGLEGLRESGQAHSFTGPVFAWHEAQVEQQTPRSTQAAQTLHLLGRIEDQEVRSPLTRSRFGQQLAPQRRERITYGAPGSRRGLCQGRVQDRSGDRKDDAPQTGERRRADSEPDRHHQRREEQHVRVLQALRIDAQREGRQLGQTDRDEPTEQDATP